MANNILNAMVTGAGGVFGHGTVAALKGAALEVRTIAVDCKASASGLYLADEAYVIPEADDPHYAPRLVDLCRQHKVDVVFVTSGFEIPVIAALREGLEADTGAVFIVNSPEMLAITNDKWATCQALSEAGLSAPLSTVDTTADALRNFTQMAGFPVVVKPRRGQGSRGVRVCDDLGEVIQAMNGDKPMIAQRAIGDSDHEYTVGVLGVEEGEILGSITLRRYLKGGITGAAEVIEDESIRRYAEAVARLLRPRGYCNVQLRLDGDTPCAFEINGRVSSSTAFRALAGFNEPEILIRYYLLGERVTPPPPRRLRMVRAYEERIVDDERWDRLHET